MRDTENILRVSALDIDMMGFIFYPDSPRFVHMISSQAGILPDYSEERKNRTSAMATGESEHRRSRIKRVGVFVDDMPQNIVTRVYNYSLDYIQLHGDESRVACENLRATLDPDIRPGIKIVKAIGVTTPDDLKKCEQYAGAVDLFLFDTKCKMKGGSGEQFDWSVLDSYDGDIPFLLSGGIGPGDVERVKAFNHPKCIGIDVNSKFETEPALKDVELLRKFIKQIRQ